MAARNDRRLDREERDMSPQLSGADSAAGRDGTVDAETTRADPAG
jgi:hypothetical protein